ncbi:MAG: hypothetical protein ACK4SU_05300 [Dictyoglomus sp.]
MNKERFGVFFFFFLLFFFFIEARIIILSLFPDEKLIKNSANNIQRGKILDRSGVELALSKDYFSIYIRPKRLSEEKKQAIYKELSKIHFFNKEDLKNIFSEKESDVSPKISSSEFVKTKDISKEKEHIFIDLSKFFLFLAFLSIFFEAFLYLGGRIYT